MSEKMEATNRLRRFRKADDRLNPWPSEPVLQQLWQETHKWRDDAGNSYVDLVREEWRDVPVEEE